MNTWKAEFVDQREFNRRIPTETHWDGVLRYNLPDGTTFIEVLGEFNGSGDVERANGDLTVLIGADLLGEDWEQQVKNTIREHFKEPERIALARLPYSYVIVNTECDRKNIETFAQAMYNLIQGNKGGEQGRP